jgi:hypothetical protein
MTTITDLRAEIASTAEAGDALSRWALATAVYYGALGSSLSYFEHLREAEQRRQDARALERWDDEGGAIHEHEDVRFLPPRRLVFWTRRMSGRETRLEVPPEHTAFFLLMLRLARDERTPELIEEIRATMAELAPELLTTGPDLSWAVGPYLEPTS